MACQAGKRPSSSTLETSWSRTSCQILRGHPQAVYSVTVSRDGKYIASAGAKGIILWDIMSGTIFQHIVETSTEFYSVVISADGKRIITSDWDKDIKIWDSGTGNLVRSLAGKTYWMLPAMALSHRGDRIVSGCQQARLWDAGSGELITELKVPCRISSVSISEDDNLIALGGTDGCIKIWNANFDACRVTLEKHLTDVSSVAFIPSSRKLVSGSFDHTSKVWDWEMGECLFTFMQHSNWIWTVSVSPGGALVASGGHDKMIRIWRVRGGEQVAILMGHTSSVRSISWLRNGEGVVSASRDSTVRIWRPTDFDFDSESESEGMPGGSDAIGGSTRTISSVQEPHLSILATAANWARALLPATILARPDPASQESPSRDSSTFNLGGHDQPHISHGSNLSSASSIQPNSLMEGEAVSADGWTRYVPSTLEFAGKLRKRTTEAYAYGGFSDVWVCDILFTNGMKRVAALKELRAVDTRNTNGPLAEESLLGRMLECLNRELWIWAGLDHPHIAPLLGFQLRPTMCLISIWYGNGNVKSWVRSHPNEDKWRLMRQIASGMVYLHSLTPPIIHGDVKSDNVLIDDDGKAVIIDFGLSQAMEDISPELTYTSSLAAIGNARWLAPELYCENPSKRSTASDVYAFGGLLLEIATGAVPYRELVDIKVLFALAHGKPPVNDKALYPELDHDHPLWDLLFDCWRPDYEERLGMTEVETVLQQLTCDQR